MTAETSDCQARLSFSASFVDDVDDEPVRFGFSADVLEEEDDDNVVDASGFCVDTIAF
jgi:hypothetical protein